MQVKAVLDACVLFSKTLTDALLYPAQVDAFIPYWSGFIRDEWTRNLHAHQLKRGRAPDGVLSRARAMDKAFPNSCVPDDRVLAFFPAAREIAADLGKPPADDVHVLAVAMAAEAQVIVTSNTDHFPEQMRVMAKTIRRETPDQFLTRLFVDVPDIVLLGYRRQLSCTKSSPRTLQDIIHRLRDPRMAPAAAQRLTELVSISRSDRHSK